MASETLIYAAARLLAQVQHGPGMHGGIVGMLIFLAVAVGLGAYFVRRHGRAREAAERAEEEADE